MMKKIFVGLAALLLALSAAAAAALLETEPSNALQALSAAPFAAAVCCSPGVEVAPGADAQAIREAHSDGGYCWYQPDGGR